MAAASATLERDADDAYGLGREHGGSSMPPILSQSWLLEVVLEKVEDTKDRNLCSLVCRDFRDAERQTRRYLRLRCLRKHIKLVPSCFGAVTHLDLSSVFPQFARGFPYSLSQLKCLGERFPNVRSLTFFSDGCQAWLKNKRLPFGGTWSMLERVSVLQPGNCTSKNNDEAFGVFGRIVQEPLILKPRRSFTSAKDGQQCGVALRVAQLSSAGQLELEELAKADVIDLDVLSFHLPEVPAPPDLSILSSKKFAALKDISVEGNFHQHRDSSFTEDNLEALLHSLPSFTSSLRLCIQIVSPPHLSRFPLHSELAARLRNLSIRLVRNARVPRTMVDLSPILECSLLEHLELAASSVFKVDTHRDILVAVVGKCRALRSLKLDLWESTSLLTQTKDLSPFFEQTMTASSASLTEIGILSKLSTIQVNLLSLFSPLMSQVTSFSCGFMAASHLGGESYQIVGWHLLTHLSITLDGFSGPFCVDCPNLQSLKLDGVPKTLAFGCAHTQLATIHLCIQDAYGSRKPDRHQIVEELQKLRSLTSLSIDDLSVSAIFWSDEKVVEAIAAMPFLKKLAVSCNPGEYASRYFLPPTFHQDLTMHFDRLLASPSLTELCVDEPPMERSLEGVYEKLYGQRKEVSQFRNESCGLCWYQAIAMCTTQNQKCIRVASGTCL